MEKLVKTSARPKTRLQALCALDGLGGVTPEVMIGALKDSHSVVRENAIRISEPWLKTTGSKNLAGVSHSSINQLGELLLKTADDPALRVRYQLGFTLGEWDDARAAQALVKLAVKDGDNAEMQVAVMSSAPPHLGEMLKRVLKTGREDNRPSGQLLDKLFGLAATAGDEASLVLALTVFGNSNGEVFSCWHIS